MLQKVFTLIILALMLLIAPLVNITSIYASSSPVILAALPPGCTTAGSGGGCAYVQTAIGAIPTDAPGLVQTIFGLLLGISGGVAILLIIASGYEMMTSQGNPEKVKGARERLTSAIVGLLFIIFSIAILQTIGVDILHIPGLNR